MFNLWFEFVGYGINSWQCGINSEIIELSFYLFLLPAAKVRSEKVGLVQCCLGFSGFCGYVVDEFNADNIFTFYYQAIKNMLIFENCGFIPKY